jgi:hypothetical protein
LSGREERMAAVGSSASPTEVSSGAGPALREHVPCHTFSIANRHGDGGTLIGWRERGLSPRTRATMRFRRDATKEEEKGPGQSRRGSC